MKPDQDNTLAPHPNLTRRQMLGGIGLAGAGAALTLGTGGFAGSAMAAPTPSPQLDTAILQLLLQLEYLEAEFYCRAAGLDSVPGSGNAPVVGGRKVNFQTPAIAAYANEIARDEKAHVRFLRNALGENSTPRPPINFTDAFAAAAQAAGLGAGFDAFANEVNFLLGAFVFEDVGVTGYRGTTPLIQNKTVLSSVAGILAVEAYHAGNIRTVLFNLGGAAVEAANAISDARDSLDGPGDLDQKITFEGQANIVPTDRNGLAFTRTASQVLRIVFLTPNTGVSSGGFFPNGVNGTITTT